MHLKSLPATVLSAVVLSLMLFGSQSAAAQAVSVSLPNVHANVGESIQIPVTVGDISGRDVTTYYIRLQYDPAVIDFTGAETANTVSEGYSATVFQSADKFTVVYAAPVTRPLSGSGTLVFLKATVVAEGSTDLAFDIMQINDGQVPSTTTDGFFSTEEPTTANVGVSLSASAGVVISGAAFDLSAKVSNSGPDAAADVETLITLPESVAFTSASSGCSHAEGTVTCTSSSLASGASVTHTLSLTAPEDGGPISFGASTSSSAIDPQTTNNSTTLLVTVASDLDGIPDDVENSVPSRDGSGTGDGNGDGVPDSEQENVASLPNETDGTYVTIEAPAGTALVDVSISDTPPAGAPPVPANVDFPDGFIAFEVEATAGAAVTVTVYTTQQANSYFKYGATPDDPEPHWYEFLYDGTTGAEINEDSIVLHFVDGGRGDADLTANGVVDDPGGPAFNTNSAPVAAADTYAVEEDVVLTVAAGEGILQNDVDANGDDLEIELISNVEHGTLELSGNGSFTYTPDENYFGVDGFSYAISDGFLGDTAVVTIEIAAINDAPDAAAILTPIGGTSLTIGGGISENPLDPEAELLSVTWSESDDAEGDEVAYTLVLAGDEDFSSVIGEIDLGTATELSVSVAQAAEWFDAIHGSTELGASATLYLRVDASDGTAESEGTAKSVTLIRGTITSVGGGEMPASFELQGNYPNPFNPATHIVFDLPQQAQVSVEIFDALGRRVLALPAQPVAAGANRSVDLDASALPSGSYIYRITAEMDAARKVASGVMTLMK